MFSELSPGLSVFRSDFRNDDVISWSSAQQSGTLVLGPAYLKTHGYTSHSIDDTSLAYERLIGALAPDDQAELAWLITD